MKKIIDRLYDVFIGIAIGGALSQNFKIAAIGIIGVPLVVIIFHLLPKKHL